MATLDERLAAAEAKVKQIKAAKQQAEARKKHAESKMKRTQDTRRKILRGALISLAEDSGKWPETIQAWHDFMSDNLTRIDDRALFNLPPKKELKHD